MKKSRLLMLISCLIFSGSSLAAVVTTTITFDGLATGSTYIEDGFLFDGFIEKSSGLSSTPAPVARLYGNNPITISRVDGLPFTLEGFYVVYRGASDNPWRIDNGSSGFDVTRAGLFTSGQYPTGGVTNETSLRIIDLAFRSTVYYEFDNFVFTHNSPVPIPSALWLFGSGLLGLIGLVRRKNNGMR